MVRADLIGRIRLTAPVQWSHGYTLWKTDEDLWQALQRADSAICQEKVERRTGRDGRGQN